MPAPVFDAQQVQANPMMNMVNEQMARQFAISINTLKTNITKIYSLVWGQCTAGLQAEVKSEQDYEQHAAVYDTLWLLQTVKRISSGVITRGNSYSNMLKVLSNFMNDVRQGRNESEDSWYKRFKAECNTLESANLSYIFYNRHTAGHAVANVNPMANEIAEETEKCRAMFFLQFSNMQRYPDLMEFLKNSEMLNNDQYPTTLVTVYGLLLQYRNNTRDTGNGGNNHRRNGRQHQPGSGFRVSFFQREMPEPDRDNPVPGTDGCVIDRQCYRCYGYGHISSFCPQAGNGRGGRGNDNSNVQALQVGISLTQRHESSDNISVIDPCWILLDTCSKDSVVSNLD
eukprot:CAMPEP_0195535818 /NCGR_PEP_ID=MMETSP0794_2-20130614/44994_1 /TAXON_ID=515487 /ORGANISM="Stephanopyxis turris, Strain CCMP 815" /LENGTH=341 /DNA_ID=CAMNT_0040669067 /DNA_START=481 /DNA_END=1503 /DNA_ORIENTATION=+